ncbi:MAG: hypothetical protein QXT77_08000 [Candidatus Methanomethylicaceae archaeon]
MTKLDERGREVVSSVPVAPPVGYQRQPSMVEIIRAQIRSERLAMEAAAAGYETFEEADDFEIEGEFDPMDETTPYEAVFEPPAAPNVVPISASEAPDASAEARSEAPPQAKQAPQTTSEG